MALLNDREHAKVRQPEGTLGQVTHAYPINSNA